MPIPKFPVLERRIFSVPEVLLKTAIGLDIPPPCTTKALPVAETTRSPFALAVFCSAITSSV